MQPLHVGVEAQIRDEQIRRAGREPRIGRLKIRDGFRDDVRARDAPQQIAVRCVGFDDQNVTSAKVRRNVASAAGGPAIKSQPSRARGRFRIHREVLCI